MSAPHSTRAPVRDLSPAVLLSLLCLLYLLMFVNRVNISTAAPLIKTDLRLTNTQLGVIFSAFAIPYAGFQLIGGWIGDKLGPRLALASCCAIVAASTIAAAAAAGFASLFAVRLALGFGEGAAFPTATRALSSWTPSSRWGFAQGITHAFGRIGNALTPALMAGLLAAVSWRASFVILGLATLLWLFFWIWLFRNRASASRDAARMGLDIWLRLARRILPVTIVDFCYGWTLWLFLTWIPAFFCGKFSS